jgi:hypothetical protein
MLLLLLQLLQALDRAHLLHLVMRSTVSPWYKKTLAAALPASYTRSVLLQEAGLLRYIHYVLQPIVYNQVLLR